MMASNSQVLYERDGVYIHINVNSNTSDKDAHIPGKVYLLQKTDGTFLEWKAEEVVSLDGHSEQDWAVISSVGYQPDRDSDPCTKADSKAEWKKYNVNFDVLDLKSFKRNAPNHGWAYIIFILKDGSTFPALHFHSGGSKALLKELEKFVHIRRSRYDKRLFIIQDHDPDALSKSFDELNLFSDSQVDYIAKFVRDPYTTTLGSFSRVTNFLRDTLLSNDTPVTRPHEEMAELLQDDLSGVEISTHDEPGFEVVTKTKLPPRPEVERGSPLTSQQWSQHLDKEGKIKDVDKLLDQIFRGGIEPSFRLEVWKFLLGYYEWNSTYKSRTEARKKKVDSYFAMKLQWKTISAEQEKRFSLLKERKGLIEKDVTRTDRTHRFFEGEGNPNLQVLNDILMTYCMYNFDLGYVQGMSDLLSPILVVMENEVDAFWCFAGLMERMCNNFEMDQGGMKAQLAEIHKLMQFTDPELCNYLESHESGNFYFCFRWILIHFKREFPFNDVQRLWEVIWTDRPCKNFHLLICLAILDSEKSTLMENKFGFTEILKHINDICFAIHLEDTLKKAEGIYLQLKECKKLPDSIQEILGFKVSPANSGASSGYSTPVVVSALTSSIQNISLSSSLNSSSASAPLTKSARFKPDSSSKLQLPVKENCTSTTSGSGSTTPDDSSIEILSENCNNGMSQYYS
ncbi:hypothetical protein ACJMK2_030276 [Sinanodonta woodiana]|uniref:TBC1 domain family member 15 n=1 Tax=Sinanodonta woodiana TaxID=1069815 RepID=A0ABD3XGN8_SINWO